MFTLKLPRRLQGFLAALLVGLSFLALSLLPASAQNIPPTSPCTVGTGTTPPGWIIISNTPDCSTLDEWPLAGPWVDGPLPAIPTGDTTFTSMWAREDGTFEQIGTTMTGLIPGREYRVPFFGIGRGGTEASDQYTIACSGMELSTDGHTEEIEVSSTEWTHRAFVFTATSPSQQLTVRAVHPNLGSGDPSCGISFAMGVQVLDVVKTASGNPSAVGDTVDFTITVTNTGVETLNSVGVSDNLLERVGGGDLTLDTAPTFVSSSGSSPEGTLAPDESATYSASYTLTQEDVDAGGILNQATGSGTSPTAGEFITLSSPADGEDQGPTEVPVPRNPALTLTKDVAYMDATGDGVVNAGDELHYSFTLENSGNVTLSDVQIVDPLVTVDGGSLATLAPGATDTDTFSAVLTITQDLINAGSVGNSATANATAPGDTPVTAPSNGGDDVEFTFPDDKSISLTKTATLADGDGKADAGDTVTYNFTVTNTGIVTLHDITIDDPVIAVPGMLASLAPGESDSSTFAVAYTLTQDDVNAGEISNQATVNALSPDDEAVSDLSDDPAETADVDAEEDREPDDPTVLALPWVTELGLEKTGTYDDRNGNGITDAGDVLSYTITIVNDGNVPMEDVSPDDAGPTFGGVNGTGSLTAFTPASATLEVGEEQVFTASYTITEADAGNAIGVEDGVSNRAAAQGTMPDGGTFVSPQSAPSLLSLPGVSITKTAGLQEIQGGGRVPYTITVAAMSDSFVADVVDLMPGGFSYVPGTARISGVAAEPEVEGREVRFEDLTLGGEEVVIELSLVASGASDPGTYVNRAYAIDDQGRTLSVEASAAVEIVPDPVFDCGDVIGRVFDDLDRNGYQDAGEPGLAAVRVATVKGLVVKTDIHGRFSIPCAALPDARIGSTFMMKLDTRSLPSGYRVTTENPRAVRLTAGKATRINFGASVGRIVRLELTDAAFLPGGAELKPAWHGHLPRLVSMLEGEESVLRIAYADAMADSKLAAQRISQLRRTIAEMWKTTSNRYRLNIEAKVIGR